MLAQPMQVSIWLSDIAFHWKLMHQPFAGFELWWSFIQILETISGMAVFKILETISARDRFQDFEHSHLKKLYSSIWIRAFTLYLDR